MACKHLLFSDIFILLEMLWNLRTSMYFFATIFTKSISRPTSQTFQVIQFVILRHAPIVDLYLKLPSFLLYLLIWTTFWLWPFAPPRHVQLQLPEAPSIKVKHMGTSNRSYISPLSYIQPQHRLRTHRNAADVGQYMPLTARYLQYPITSRRPPVHNLTPP